MRTARQIMIAELDDQQFITNDLSNSKAVREAALARVRVLENALGFPPTPSYNGRPPKMSANRRQRVADLLMVVGWGVAIAGLALFGVDVPTKVAIGVTFGGFIIALAGAMVRP